MSNVILKSLKATIIDIIVAFILSIILVFSIKLIVGDTINMAIGLLNTISIEKNDTVATKIQTEVLDDGTQKIKNYPNYGEKYATLRIDSADIELPVYFGDTMDILKNGIGHSSGSYFPGEGASMIYCAHNTKDKFRNFSELKKDDIVSVITDYGEFTYKIYDMKIIEETDLDKLPIQKDEEILMMYTCYPFDALGYTTKRYAVYSKFVSYKKSE